MNLTHLKHLLWLTPFFCFWFGYQCIATLYGNHTIIMPTLTGTPLPEAFMTLSKLNLNPRLVSTKEMANLPAGTVLSQTPAPQTKIKPQQTVYLVVSRMPQSLTIPQVAGQRMEHILPTLKTAGITYKLQYIQSHYPKNYCIAQLPTAGQPSKDNKMILYVSKGDEKPVIMPNFKNRPVPEIVDFLEHHQHQVTVFHNTGQEADHRCTFSCKVIDQRPQAGSCIKIDGQKPLHVQLQVAQYS